MPDYDGLGMPDTKHEDDAGIWLARIVFAPLYLTTEFLVRRPTAALSHALERGSGTSRLYDFFAFGPHHKIGFIPVAFLETGFNPGVGVWMFWNDAVTQRNDIRLHYEMWPTEWLGGSIRDRYHIDDHRWVEGRVSGTQRFDQVFYGFGPSSLQSQQSRYGVARFDATGAIGARVWRSSEVSGAVGVRKVDLFDGHYGDDPTLVEEAHSGAFAIPWGIDRGYAGPTSTLKASVDTRAPGRNRGHSARIEIESEQGADLEHTPASAWMRWGGSAGAFVDLNGRSRILGLELAAVFADPLGHEPVPFTELATLGGDAWMPGYFQGRLVDRSATVAKVSYTWPVAPMIDAQLQAAVGNVFGSHLEDFDVHLLRFSGAFGLKARTDDPPIGLLVGFGTETFDHGAQVDSVRVTFGVSR